MTVVGLAAAVLAFGALRTRPGDERVAVAKHQIRAGERVHRRDFRITSVSLGEAGLSRLVGAVDLRAVDGRIAGATIEPGELVPRRVLRPRAARGGLRAISIPVDPARAVGGRLAAGDRVDVLVADDDGVAIIVPDARGARRRRARSWWHRGLRQPVHGDGCGRRGAVAPRRGRRRLRWALARAHHGRDPRDRPRHGRRPGVPRHERGSVTCTPPSSRSEPSIALVFSPDPWVEQLHRFLSDHGGARVRQLVVDPSVLDDEEFDVLVSGDRWPSLTPALVGRLHGRTGGRRRRVRPGGTRGQGPPAGGGRRRGDRRRRVAGRDRRGRHGAVRTPVARAPARAARLPASVSTQRTASPPVCTHRSS